MPKQISGLKSSDFRPLRINMLLFPLAYEFFPTVTFRLVLGEFLRVFPQNFSFFSVFSEFSARLVLFWYQSLVSILRKIVEEKNSLFFSSK